jgi:hypothetical protein
MDMCYAMDILARKSSSGVIVTSRLMPPITKDEINQFINQSILYKSGERCYRKAILGSKIPDSDSYQVYLATDTGKGSIGICSTTDRLYKHYDT